MEMVCLTPNFPAVYSRKTPTVIWMIILMTPQILALAARSEYTTQSCVVELIVVHANMFFQEKPLINGVDDRLRFIREKNNFCLMSSRTVEYRVSIVSANVIIKKVSIAPGVKLAHANLTHDGPCCSNVHYHDKSTLQIRRLCVYSGHIRLGRMFHIEPHHD
jgi:hypothetical protein